MRNTWKLLICFVCVLLITYVLRKGNKLSFDELDSIHFNKLYPSSLSHEEFGIKKQKAIGICVNFNHDPDKNGHTLSSILPYYTTINEYVVILTPSPLNRLSNRNIQLLNDTSSFVHHIECLNSRSGQYQHKCLLLCAQFYSLLKMKHSTLQGILYLSDDLYFNFVYVFSHPERFPLDEIWTTPWLQVVDIVTNDKGHLGNSWFWWKSQPHLWNSFKHFFFFSSEKYREIFQTLYGSNKRLAVGIADLLYLPFADQQLSTLISTSNELMSLLPSDIFCEMIFSLIVDSTMALTHHWPFQNDRDIYNSSINRLNNLSFIEQMEKSNLIKNGRDPYSLNRRFRQRPCLFNPDGFIWDHHRHNQQLYQTAILSGTVPITYLSKPWLYTTEFIHPMKLSNPNDWVFHLWHQGMKRQIQLFQTYQQNKKRLS